MITKCKGAGVPRAKTVFTPEALACAAKQQCLFEKKQKCAAYTVCAQKCTCGSTPLQPNSSLKELQLSYHSSLKDFELKTLSSTFAVAPLLALIIINFAVHQCLPCAAAASCAPLL